jgi:FAD:protein FMN transferase
LNRLCQAGGGSAIVMGMVFESCERAEQVERFMDRPVTVDFREPLPVAMRHELVERVFGWLRAVDALFDARDSDSQVGLLDQGLLRHGLADPLVHAVLNDCARLNRRTEGYFDIFAGEHLDLSGYVKSWALQRASALLTEAGAPDHRIRAGGDVYAAGRPAPGRTWQIAVPDPFRPSITAWRVPATDLGVATTDGHARVDHIRDPWTRRPASGLASVTVAGPDLGTAAGYAIAAYAMGPSAQGWLAGLDDAYAYALIDEDGRRFHGWVPGLVLAA